MRLASLARRMARLFSVPSYKIRAANILVYRGLIFGSWIPQGEDGKSRAIANPS
jgi:hypothetical protein